MGPDKCIFLLLSAFLIDDCVPICQTGILGTVLCWVYCRSGPKSSKKFTSDACLFSQPSRSADGSLPLETGHAEGRHRFNHGEEITKSSKSFLPGRFRPTGLSPEVTLLPQHLMDGGYRTHMVGMGAAFGLNLSKLNIQIWMFCVKYKYQQG